MRHLEKTCTVCSKQILPTDFGWVHVDRTDSSHQAEVNVTEADLWVEDDEEPQTLLETQLR